MAAPTYSSVTAGASSPASSQGPVNMMRRDNGVQAPRVARVEVPSALIPEDHLPCTFRLVLSGWGAAGVQPERLGALLAGRNWLPLDTWRRLRYYRLHNPTLRFISVEGLPHGLEHGMEDRFNFDQNCPDRYGTIRVENVKKPDTKIRLEFVPPGAGQSYIKGIMQQAGLEVIQMTKSKRRADMWEGTVTNQEEGIPHYIEGETICNAPVNGRRKVILVTVPHRRIQCYHCGDPRHWSNRCEQLEKEKVERRKQREMQEQARDLEKQMLEVQNEEKERARSESQRDVESEKNEENETGKGEEEKEDVGNPDSKEDRRKGENKDDGNTERIKPVGKESSKNGEEVMEDKRKDDKDWKEVQKSKKGRKSPKKKKPQVEAGTDILTSSTPGACAKAPVLEESLVSTPGTEAVAGSPGDEKSSSIPVTQSSEPPTELHSTPDPKGRPQDLEEALSLSADKQFLSLQGDAPQKQNRGGEWALRKTLFPTPKLSNRTGEGSPHQNRISKRDSDKMGASSPGSKRRKSVPRKSFLNQTVLEALNDKTVSQGKGKGNLQNGRGRKGPQGRDPSSSPAKKMPPPRPVPRVKQEPKSPTGKTVEKDRGAEGGNLAGMLGLNETFEVVTREASQRDPSRTPGTPQSWMDRCEYIGDSPSFETPPERKNSNPFSTEYRMNSC